MKTLSILSLLFFAIVSMTQAANIVDITVTGPGVWNADTLYTDYPVEIQISIENDFVLGGIGLGFNLYNPEGGVSLSYPAQVDGFGYYEAVTVNPASRMYPTASVWDLGNLIVSDTGLDMANAGLNGTLPDTVNIGGVALSGGLPIGAMEHMLSLYFIATGPGVGVFETLCMDSTFIPTAAPFVFIDGGGSTMTPTVSWDEGGECFVVVAMGQDCPVFDSGLTTTMDIYRFGSNSTTLSATDLEDDPISFTLLDNTGNGIAIVDDNGDGTCEVTYTSAEADFGTSVIVTVYACDPFHSLEMCMYRSHSITFNVFDYIAGDFNGDVQANLGDVVYMVNYIFRGGPPPVDLACSDVNNDCEVNIGDGIFVINYIFRGGPVPTCSDCMD
ncbi:MAG: hypothetical protein KAR42_01240 [candidate division Zixibacteria bacterium]|nr:hypothetical protein [candidate division Zixibacteria bacterium]